MSVVATPRSATEIRLRLNALLRGDHVTRPIEGPQLTLRVVSEGGAKGGRGLSGLEELTRSESVYLLSDSEGYTRALTGRVADEARRLMKALKACRDA